MDSKPVPVGKLITLSTTTLKYTTQEFTPKVKKPISVGYGGGDGHRPGYSSSYVYPHKETSVVFTIHEMLVGRAIGRSSCGKTVEVYPKQQDVVMYHGGTYSGIVHSIQNNKTIYLRPRSAKISHNFPAVTQDKVVGPCGFCDTQVTETEIEAGSAFKYGDCYIHFDCSETMEKGVQK